MFRNCKSCLYFVDQWKAAKEELEEEEEEERVTPLEILENKKRREIEVNIFDRSLIFVI